MEPDEPIITHDETTTDANLAPDNFSDSPADSDAGAENFDTSTEVTSAVGSAEEIWDGPGAAGGDEEESDSDAPVSAASEPVSFTADANDAEDMDVSSSGSIATHTDEDYAGAGTAPTYEQAIAEINRIAGSLSDEVARTAADALPDTTATADPYSSPPMTYEQAMAEIDRFEESLRTGGSEASGSAAGEPSNDVSAGMTASADVTEVSDTRADIDGEDVEPSEPASPEEPAAEALSRTELNTMLASKAKDADEDLSWKTSVVDLLKLVGKDSSFAARERYAVELGFPEDKLENTPSAELNMWLHKQLMTTLAENGGTLPSNLA